MWRVYGLVCAWCLALLAQVCSSQSQRRPSFTCGGNITGQSGIIGSQGYPGVYPPNTKCVWRITVPEGKVVVLSFRFLDLENDSLCRYDYVDVDYPAGVTCSWHIVAPKNQIIEVKFEKFDVERDNYCRYDHVSIFNGGEINDARRIGKYCGDSPPAPMTNVTIDSTGDQYCGGRLDKPSGTFKTPNWPDRDYPAGVTCSWHIVAPKNQIIEVKFEKFDVERDNYCRYDHVSIFNGGEINDARRIGKYCGDSPPAPVLSEGNQLLVQFLSDLSLTADGFIGHYKFRPKKFSVTTTLPPTTTQPLTTRPIPLKYSVALCRQKCKRRGTLESNFCSSNFVLTGTVISAVTRGGSVHATVSIIKVYKEGNLAIQQAGKTMSTKMVILCKKCPFVRRGLNYIFMGHVDEEGLGKVGPHHFVLAFKSKNQKALSMLKNKRC
ncbi:procollagen C-endopeptidase enhancer 2 [Hippocampus comes]|uniref:procollagen C-endopeptidase enhancer 2 n=2 Tax=Hippocampus comes TaxID=109280 RepID=UPI00094EA5B5|nr:PREDICTED: procollagen C-endopeptidase enhancer 2 [Hippocampus comes]